MDFIKITAHNDRERKLIRILKSEIKHIEDDYKEYGIQATTKYSYESANGLLAAMFYLDMIPEPVSAWSIYEAIEKKYS